jgi:hypothetical protein
MATAPPTSDTAPAQPPARGGLHALRLLWRMLFVRQVRVQRVEGKLAVSLDQKAADQAAGADKASKSRDDAMHDELDALFVVAPPGSRKTLRHLTAVQNGLKRKDPKGLFLYAVDPSHLRNALRQLDGMMPKQPSAGLAALRARMVDAIGTRERRDKRLEMLSPRSDLMQSSRMEVSEGRASDFDRVLESSRAKDPA